MSMVVNSCVIIIKGGIIVCVFLVINFFLMVKIVWILMNVCKIMENVFRYVLIFLGVMIVFVGKVIKRF